MTPGRLVHKATDGLPDSAWQVMFAGFRERKPYRSIVLELARLGFNVPERTVARRAIEWRAEQVRREAFKVAATEGARTNFLEEVVGILGALDLTPGFKVRGRRRVQRSVLSFLDDPSGANAQAIARELVRYRLESLAFAARSLGAAESRVGDLGALDDVAGELGGG